MGEEIHKKIIAWDVAPDKEYFEQLFRISRNQIIWGGNYFGLPPTRCFLIWRKLTISESFSMAMAEYAWTSFNGNAKVFECTPQGKKDDPRFHPCLPKGELVFFNNEWKKIEDVNIGDKNIFGNVSRITKHDAVKIIEINTTDGNKTKATWNHPFLILRNNQIAWINAEKIRKGDKILCLRNTRQQKKDICDTEKRTENYEWSIALYGKNTTEKFPKGCKYTTLTETKPITIFPICNLSLPLNTHGYTKVATWKTGYGISLANIVGNIKQSITKIGTLIKKQDGLPQVIVDHAMSKKLSKNVECELQTVGNVRIIHEKTEVINLSIDGIPAFETKVGISHNTQKPVELYKWILHNYAKPGDKILDTHVGSASSLIACKQLGFDYIGFEIDPEYYRQACERIERETAQMTMFDMGWME